MSSWRILDRNEHSDEYQPIVCSDKYGNFSIAVNAVLANDTDSKKLPVKSFIRLPYICIYFENVLLIFSDDKCKLVLFRTFDAQIKCLLVQNKHDAVVVLLDNGMLHRINVQGTNEAKTKVDIKETMLQSVMIEQDDESIVLFSETNMLSLYSLRLNHRTDRGLDVALSPIKYKEISAKNLFFIDLHNKRMQNIHGSSLHIRLLPNRNIHAICPITNLNYIVDAATKIDDVRVFKNSSKLLTLDSETHSLAIYDFYNLAEQFSVKITDDCSLIGGINNFALYTDFKNGKLYLYMIQENSPMSQLEILISLRDYEGAELFAKQHNLSPTAVLELKAKFLLGNLKKHYTSDAANELYDILTSCDNIEFLVGCSCEAVESEINLSNLLDYSKTKLFGTDNTVLNNRVDELLWKVEAFKMFEIESEKLVMDWNEFVDRDPINICKEFIINDMLDSAAIVWLKCFRFISGKLRLENIADLLCSISLDTKLNSLLRWLEYFIPSVMNIMPYSADMIITWAKDRICILQSSVHWPEVGIQFAEKFSNLMFNSKGLIAFIPPSADNIFFLIDCMTQIQTLKKEYNIIISLRDFTTLCSNELTKLILRKSFTEDLNALLNNFLDGFINRHGLNHDSIIGEYIDELLGSTAIDEAKLKVLLDNIYNIDERYRFIIQVLKSAQVPWSQTIRTISAEAVAAHHPATAKIHIEIIHADIRTIKMKYKCQDLSSEDYELLLRIIIRKGDADMMKDIDTITGVYRNLREDAYLLCVQKYIETNAVQRALDLFRTFDDGFKNTCVNAFLLILENQLGRTSINREMEMNYLDFLKSTRFIDDSKIHSLYSVYKLKNRYDLIISYSKYCIEDYRKYYYVNWCRERMDCLKRPVEDIRTMISNSVQVGRLLTIAKAECLLILSDLANVKPFLQVLSDMVAERSIRLDCDVQTIDLILKLSPTFDFTNIASVELIMDYLLRILDGCGAKSMSYCIDVCSWFTSIYFANNSVREILSLSKVTSFYNPHVIYPIVPVWKDIITRNTLNGFKCKELVICVCNSEECVDGSQCLPKLLEQCQMHQNDIYFIKIIALCGVKYFKNDLTPPQWFKDLNDAMIKLLIAKMISADKPDHLLISALLFSYSSINQWLNDSLSNCANPVKEANIAQHILKSREMHQNINIPYTQAFIINSQNSIDSKLEVYGISLKNFYQDDTYNITTFLESLVVTNECKVEIIEEFCKITNSDLNKVLTCYLFIMLKSWNDDYEFVNDCFGKVRVTACDRKLHIMQNCMKVLERISSKSELIDNLTKLFRDGEVSIASVATIAINLYSYEAYIFILDLLYAITGAQKFLREYMLLKFLQNYQRFSKPKQTELDEFSMKEQFPKVGFYRLPFQYLMSKCWDNLKPEITLETYKNWLPIACLLPLDVQTNRDMICSRAVKQSMTLEKSLNDASNIKWTLHLKKDRLLKEAYECVQHISNLEWAGACLYHIFLGSSFGADQVAAVDKCYQFAEHWAEIEPNNNAVKKKMKTKHLLTSTAFILHKIGLAEDRLLSLCENPHRLIEALYSHKTIITRYQFCDINNAVDEIAEKHNLTSATVRMNIIERILNVNNSQTDNTSSVHNTTQSESDGTLSRENLMRACYILKGTNQMMAAVYLLRISLGNVDGESYDNYNCKIKALQCLLSLASNEIIEKFTNQSVSSLWLKLWELYFVNGLNLISLEYLISVFYEDKLKVVHMIWHARDHSRLTVLLIVKMLLVYDLQVADKLLEDIIEGVLKFDLMFEVRNFLDSVKSIHGPNYVKMWNHILLKPFRRLETPLVGHQRDECFDALKLLPMCPILSKVDLSPIYTNCIRVNLIEMAVLVLPHLPRKERKSVVEKIGKIKKSTLQELKAAKSRSILTLDLVMTILKQDLPK